MRLKNNALNCFVVVEVGASTSINFSRCWEVSAEYCGISHFIKRTLLLVKSKIKETVLLNKDVFYMLEKDKTVEFDAAVFIVANHCTKLAEKIGYCKISNS